MAPACVDRLDMPYAVHLISFTYAIAANAVDRPAVRMHPTSSPAKTVYGISKLAALYGLQNLHDWKLEKARELQVRAEFATRRFAR